MHRRIALIVCLAASSTLAGCVTPVYVKEADVQTVTITWLRTSDPSQPCARVLNAEKGGCAIKTGWAAKDCLIVTPAAEKTSDQLLGEEVRHCFGWGQAQSTYQTAGSVVSILGFCSSQAVTG